MQTEKKGSRKKMKNSNRSRIIALACCVVLLVTALISGGLAKYVTQKQSSGDGQTFDAQLFENGTNESGENLNGFEIVEMKNKMETNGAFDQDMGPDWVSANTYYLIPGTRMFKYAFINYRFKTDIPAYLYLEVKGAEPSDNLSYDIFDDNDNSTSYNWTKISGGNGETGVYLYTVNGTPVKLKDVDGGIPGIFRDMYVYVYSKLPQSGDPLTISVTGWAIQAEGPVPETLNEAKAEAKALFESKEANKTKMLIDSTAELKNTFIPGEVKSSVVENGEPVEGETSVSAKNSITVKNTGNVPALVRAKLVVNWIKLGEDGKPVRDEAGTPVIIANPVGTDGNPLTITPSYSSDWTTNLGDGYCYYNDYVAAGAATTDLLAAAITAPTNTPAGYAMQVEVITEAMQATGYNDPRNPVDGTGTDANSAMYLAWNHFFNGSTWQ